jgi:hypothetical protein
VMMGHCECNPCSEASGVGLFCSASLVSVRPNPKKIFTVE